MTTKIRSPRTRAQNAKLAEPGSPDFLPIVDLPWGPQFWADLRDAFIDNPAIGDALDSGLAKYPLWLEEIDREARRADAQGVPSIPEARHSLDRLAKAAKAATAKSEKGAEAYRQLSNLNDLAQVLLSAELRRQGRLPTEPDLARWLHDREKIGWAIIGAAARDAAAYKKSGPYPDVTLAVLVMGLVDLFEEIAGQRATYSIRRRHAQSSLPRSAAAQFVSVCARHILPRAPETTVLRYLEGEIADRRKAAKKRPELWDSPAA